MRRLFLPVVVIGALSVGCTSGEPVSAGVPASSTTGSALVVSSGAGQTESEYIEQSVGSFTEELEQEGLTVVRRDGVLHVEIDGELYTSVEGRPGVRTFVNSEALDAIDISEQSDICDPEKTVEEFTPEAHAELVETGGNARPPCDGLVFTDQYVTLNTGERALPAIDSSGQIIGYWAGSSVRAVTSRAE